MEDFSQDKVQNTIMTIFSQNRAHQLDAELLLVFKALSPDTVEQQCVEVLNIFLQNRVQQRFVEQIVSVILPPLSLLNVLPKGHRFLRNVSLRGWPGMNEEEEGGGVRGGGGGGYGL